MKIPFEKKYRQKYYSLLEEVFESNFLADGPKNSEFENKFGKLHKLKASTISGGGPGLLALLEYVGVRNKEVIVPTNTFVATPLAVMYAGGKVVFADCKREDLCIGLENIKKVVTNKTKAIIVVHIGGHIAFDIEEIKEFCEKKNIFLIEDCAHAHGSSYKGKKAGSFGIGGAYSFYATKTLPIGSGGMVVSQSQEVIDFVNKYKIYGKDISNNSFPINGFNFRMSEIEATFGLIQIGRFNEILTWKKKLAKKFDEIFDKRVFLPKNMESGYYKYIVFEPIKEQTGAVYDLLCSDLWNYNGEFPNSKWVSQNHWCAPIYYGWDGADLPTNLIAKRLR